MSRTVYKANHDRWILAWPVLGMFVIFLLGAGCLTERFTSFAAVVDETDWTLANGKVAEKANVDWTLANTEDVQEEKVGWSLAKTDSKDTKENEPDWTLA
ncbi:MAG: hypothetical protein KC592_06540 [Nitrospira sp.]|nr:hypothetical protein [Nitrospira sp.]